MAGFFKKINGGSKQSPKPTQGFEPPPTSALPAPPSIPPSPRVTSQNSQHSHHVNTLAAGPEMSVKSPPATNESRYISPSNKTQITGSYKPSMVSPVSPKIAHKAARISSSSSNHSYSENSFNRASSTPNTQQQQQQPESTLNHQVETPWKKLKLYNSPFPRIGHAVSSYTSTSGALYLMGGLSGNEVYGDMWVLEPIRDNSTHRNSRTNPYIASPIENLQQIPSPRTGHASILIGNAFIIFAGDTAIKDNQELDNNLYFFNISSLKWTITSPDGVKPCGRYNHQISVLNFEISPNKWSSQLFVYGGQLNNEYFDDLWKFDLSNFKNPANRWIKVQHNTKSVQNVPPPLSNHTMTASNDKLYIFGGHNKHIINDQLYVYDSTTNAWDICKLQGPVVLPPLYNHSATTFGSLLFIFGGKLLDDSNSADLYIIDLITFRVWKLQNELFNAPGARHGHSITINPVEKKLLIMGGDIYDNDFSDIDNSANGLIDEDKLHFLSSVIFECDIDKIEQFIDKSHLNKPIAANSADEKSVLPSSFGNHYLTKSESNINLQDSPQSVNLVSSTPLENSFTSMSNKYGKDSTNGDGKEEGGDEEDDEEDGEDEDENEIYTIDDIKAGKELNAKMDLDLVRTPVDNYNSSPGYKTPEDGLTKTPSLTKSSISNLNVSTVKSSFLEVPKLATPSIQQNPSMNNAFSPAVFEKDNLKLERLIQLVNEAKTEMKSSISKANEQITKLENENRDLRTKLENTNPDEQVIIFKKFNNLIDKREETIKILTKKLQEGENLNEKIHKLEAENSTLKEKVDNFTTITNNLDIQKEINELKESLENLLNNSNRDNSSYKELEVNYNKMKTSLNLSYNALEVSQKENKELKDEIEKLRAENQLNAEHDQSDLSKESLYDERYKMKIRDLEASLFIISQERDKLRDENIRIKKEMYNISNSDET